MIDSRETYRIEQLMSKFFSGATTPAEERELEMFFSETDLTELPEDMLAFREMISAIDGCRPTPEETQVPADLIEKLDTITRVPSPKMTATKTGRRWKIWALSGAAACILAFVLCLMPASDVTQLPVKQIARVETPASRPGEAAKEVFVEPESHAEPAVAPRKRVAKANVKATRKSTVPKAETPTEETGFIEVTDPEEVAKIVEDIGKLLAQNVEMTNHAISNLEQSIEYHREISKSLLQ